MALFTPELCVPRLSAADSDACLRCLAGLLATAGCVKGTFEAAALQRERRSPTGLPFAHGGVALPHAEPEHVLVPAIAIASLVAPVRFRQMGSPATKLEVSLVVMPAFSAKEQAAAGLGRLIELLQDGALAGELRAAESGAAMCAAIAARWGTG
jgi:PTS system galactitol-specific IIA component